MWHDYVGYKPYLMVKMAVIPRIVATLGYIIGYNRVVSVQELSFSYRQSMVTMVT